MIQIDELMLNCDVLDIITELKNQLNANGINLLHDIKDSGDNIMITCPYHKDGQERRPSAGISKSTGVFHCFTCDTVKSLPELISNCFGYDDYGVFGVQWLAKNFSSVSVEERKEIQLEFTRNNSNGVTVSAGDSKYVTEEELDSYRYIHPYMYERKLTDEVIEKFDIGYDKDTDCITFPVRDIKGRTLFVARRSVKGKYFNYPSGAEKPLYGLYEIYSDDPLTMPNEVIVCESMLDCLYFWTIHKYAVAMNGLGTELQFKQLRELPCRKLILATDNDSAGLKARERIRLNVKNKLITEFLFPENRKDANECTLEELINLKEIF